jgi:hypothetical protein
LSSFIACVEDLVAAKDLPLVIDHVGKGIAGVLITLSRLASHVDVDLRGLASRMYVRV